MKEYFYILILLELLSLTLSFLSDWRDFPSCHLGRLQSPISFRESESTYSNDFSFVYQNYKEFEITKDTKEYAYVFLNNEAKNGGYINFERGGVIKQYELLRYEIYPGLHSIDGDKSDYELHIVHKKNLDFITNKNQYRSIQDANMYLTIVLRYKTDCNSNDNIICTSDNGLLSKILSESVVNLNEYPIFQDKRAYLYEGSSIITPCDENVNYYIVKDIFYANSQIDQFKSEPINPAKIFGRPIYKNFMNYKEVMKSKYISIHSLSLFLLIFILF